MIALSAVLGIAGAVAVIAVASTAADVVGVLTLACGLAGTIWAALRMARDPDAAD
jgi:hypothetical protein